jgi:hypothetical protein
MIPYEGWVDSKQYQILSEANFIQLSNDAIILRDLIEYITGDGNILLPVPLGSSLSFLNHNDINRSNYGFEGNKTNGIKDKKAFDYYCLFVFERTYLWVENTVRNRLFRIYSNGLQTKRLSTAARCFATSNAGRTTKFH